MRPALLVLPIAPVLALALAACDVRSTDTKDGDVHVSVSGQSGNEVAVDVPGFKANLNLPGLNLGGHVDLDGAKLAPGSHVTGVDVLGGNKGSDDDHGTVKLTFTDTNAPAKVIEHYRGSLADAGFRLGGQSDHALTATKDEKTFALAIAPQGSGSRGAITITGD